MSRHLKSYAAPKSWIIPRKVTKWIIRPHPGAHELDKSLPIATLLKQQGIAQTRKEARIILNNKQALIDGKIVKDLHHSTGFMDTIQVKPNVTLRCTIDEKGRLKFINAPENEANKKICRITGKRTTKNKKIQLNLSDGRSILMDKTEYKPGDSIVLEIPSQKVLEHYPLAKGNLAFFTSGKHTGKTGKIDQVEGQKVHCTIGDQKIETIRKTVYIIGKDKPAVRL